MTEKLFQNDLFKKTSESNMIYTYHYLSTMAGEPTPFFSIKPLGFFSVLYGTQTLSKRTRNPNGDLCTRYRLHLGTEMFL
jgi:hypothetical protein